MTIQDLGSIGEFVAAIAVVVSVLYLAYQIRQNTRAMRTTAFQQVADSRSEFSLAVSLDRDLSELMVRARESGVASFDRVEQVRYRLALTSFFRRAESAFFHFEQGTLSEDTWEGIRESLGDAFTRAGAQEFWKENARIFNARFRSFIESELLPSVYERPVR